MKAAEAGEKLSLTCDSLFWFLAGLLLTLNMEVIWFSEMSTLSPKYTE
jgi:hypothetical protein